jgi:tetratricopeptide (TPR) repeat protein
VGVINAFSSGSENTQALLMTAKSITQAKAAYQTGDWTEAERLCRIILAEKSDDLDALNLLGIIAAQSQRASEAEALLSRAIAVDPNHAIAHSNLGNLLLGLGRAEEALKNFDRALEINPCDADTLYNRGSILGGMERYEEALASCDRALAIKPDFAEALNVRGNALGCLKRPMEALESFGCALKIKPDYAEALNNRGVVLRALNRLEEALESYNHALKVAPDFADATYNRGMVLSELARTEEAVVAYEQALKIKPNYVEAHWNLSLCHLQLGNFKQGWEGYEWRWHEKQLKESKRDFLQPLWLGKESLRGKTILLHGEAGLGDTIQFCRYAKHVAALGGTVLLQVQPPLLPLLVNLEGVRLILPKGATLPAFDYHCPLLSLPLAFQTALDDIPADIPYVYSDATRRAAWQNKLGRKTKPRVGLAWSGNPNHHNDGNRSLALMKILPLLQEEFDWISLQQEIRSIDVDLMALRRDIRHYGAQLQNFSDTAALVSLMDLVVSVDTSVAHLAGAMGKDVWILLPFNPDWRWLLGRDDNPWYPTVRLFRQPKIGDWESVIVMVGNELERYRTNYHNVAIIKVRDDL